MPSIISLVSRLSSPKAQISGLETHTVTLRLPSLLMFMVSPARSCHLAIFFVEGGVASTAPRMEPTASTRESTKLLLGLEKMRCAVRLNTRSYSHKAFEVGLRCIFLRHFCDECQKPFGKDAVDVFVQREFNQRTSNSGSSEIKGGTGSIREPI